MVCIRVRLQALAAGGDSPAVGRWWAESLTGAHALALLGLLLFLSAPLRGQPVVEVVSEPTSEQALKRLAEAEANDALVGSDAETVLELYRKSAENLKQAEEAAQRAAELEQLAQSLPERIKALRAWLDADPVPQTDVPGAEASEEALEATLANFRAEAERLASLVKEREAQMASLASAPRTLREAFAKSERDVAAARAASSGVEAVSEAGELDSARQFSRRARLRLEEARLQRLRLEIRTLDARAELTFLERDQALRQAEQAKVAADRIQTLLNRKREEVAALARLQAEQTEVEALGKAEVVKRSAEINAEYARELARVTESQASLLADRDEFERSLAAIEKDFQNAQQRLSVAGLSSVLGSLLREQRRALPDVRRFAKRVQARKARIAEVSVAQFQVDDALKALADPDQALADAVSADDVPPGEAAARVQIKEELATLLKDRRGLLKQLRSGYVDLLKALGELDFVEQRLSLKVQDYAAFLDERLLWIPSAAPVGAQSLGPMFSAVAWLAKPEHLAQLPPALWRHLLERPILLLAVIFLVAFLVRMLPAARRHLETVAERVGHAYSDRFGLTMETLALSLVLAMPVPLLLAAFAGQVLAADDVSPYVQAFAKGVLAIAVPLFVVRAFRNVYVRNGLGAVHFSWSEQTCITMRRSLQRVLVVLLPAAFVLAAMEAQEDEGFMNSLGRAAFIVVSLAIAWLMHTIFHPHRGVLHRYLTRVPNSWLARLRVLWYLAAMGVPLALAVLAASGYFYTALRLSEHQGLTMRLFAGAIIVYHLIMRALLVAERKLALKAAREQREARLAQASADESGGEALNVPLDIPRLNLEALNAQTRRLTRILIGWAVVVLLYMIWADVLPALNFLERVELWHSIGLRDGQEVDRAITMSDFALALVLGIVFAVAARNIPGVLEIAVLSRLPFEPGSRYAISTLVQYLIGGIGVVVVFEAIGVGWSKVQWLVAALGVGLGFGLQEIFANFISGIIILFERPVRIGDTVTLGELTGTVSRIRMRATTVTDWDRKEIVIPNKSFITDRLINWTLSDPIIRVMIRVGVAYGSDTVLVHRLLGEIAADNARVLKDPAHQVFFMGFGESTLDFELRVFVDGLSNMLAVRHEIHMAIDEAFRSRGIEIAFAQRDLHIRGSVPIEVFSRRDGGGMTPAQELPGD